MCVLVWCLGCVCMCVSGHVCVFGLRWCMHVCACVRLSCDCAVFVCASGHVCIMIVNVCLGVCMFVIECVLVL